jgi:hypothetical protein
VERACYEAQRAERQHRAVETENTRDSCTR